MITVELVAAEEADIEHVAAHLRDADRDECRAVGRDGDRAVQRAAAAAFETMAGRINGVPICLFGIGLPSLFGSVARPWMLGTDDVVDNPVVFVRHSKKVVAGWLVEYPFLENWVDERNHVSIAWLRWLGFTIDPAAPYGLRGEPFHRFWMRRPNV